MLFTFVVVCMIEFGGKEIGPSQKLKRRNKQLEKENKTLLLATQDWRNEIDALRIENEALRLGLPYPTVSEYDKQEQIYLAKVKEQLDQRNNGSEK